MVGIFQDHRIPPGRRDPWNPDVFHHPNPYPRIIESSKIIHILLGWPEKPWSFPLEAAHDHEKSGGNPSSSSLSSALHLIPSCCSIKESLRWAPSSLILIRSPWSSPCLKRQLWHDKSTHVFSFLFSIFHPQRHTSNFSSSHLSKHVLKMIF